MKHTACQKCAQAAERAREALALFTEGQGTMLDLEQLLRDLEAVMVDQDDRDELDHSGKALLARVRDAAAKIHDRRPA